jgi:hypothetical protein
LKLVQKPLQHSAASRNSNFQKSTNPSRNVMPNGRKARARFLQRASSPEASAPLQFGREMRMVLHIQHQTNWLPEGKSGGWGLHFFMTPLPPFLCTAIVQTLRGSRRLFEQLSNAFIPELFRVHSFIRVIRGHLLLFSVSLCLRGEVLIAARRAAFQRCWF